MGLPFTYAHYISDSGGNYLIKQQNELMAAAGNTVAASSNQYPGLPRNLRPRKAMYINAGNTRTVVFGKQADYASAPATLTINSVEYKLMSKTAEKVRVLRP